MKTYVARISDANSGAEAKYIFRDDPDLFTHSPATITRHFMEFVDKEIFPRQHVAYELNATFKDEGHGVVTSIGVLIFENGLRAPFMLMLSED
jgi:hypothetical protein